MSLDPAAQVRCKQLNVLSRLHSDPISFQEVAHSAKILDVLNKLVEGPAAQLFHFHVGDRNLDLHRFLIVSELIDPALLLMFHALLHRGSHFFWAWHCPDPTRFARFTWCCGSVKLPKSIIFLRWTLILITLVLDQLLNHDLTMLFLSHLDGFF